MKFAFNEFGPRCGKPLVLLHGFPMDSRVWQGVVDRSPGRIITVDLFGFGRGKNTAPFTMESAAVQLHDALAARNALPCVMAGLSMGGYLALAFAARFAADLAGFILIDTKAVADDSAGRAARDQMIALVREKGTAAVAAQMLPRMFAAGVDPAVSQSFNEIMLGCSPVAIEHAIAAMRDRADHTETFASLKCPRLILVGEEDRITPPAVALAMQNSSPGAESIIFGGAGHMLPYEQPHQTAHAIDFFRDRRIPRD
jgi:pimeloyl-ACP methyl ester carboxylesterase